MTCCIFTTVDFCPVLMTTGMWYNYLRAFAPQNLNEIGKTEMNKPLLLTKHEARTIRDALSMMNVIGAPMFTTAIHRPPNFFRTEAETFVFQWQLNDAGACEVSIHTSSKGSHGVRTSYTNSDKSEWYSDQEAFCKAYGIND
jgi:hypothetical protein